MIALTPLETEILARLHQRYGAQGFPDAASVRVVRRQNTGVGRYVELDCPAHISVADGNLGIGTYSHLKMEGVQSGMVMLAFIKDNRLVHIELATSGNEAWDGAEKSWKISDELEG